MEFNLLGNPAKYAKIAELMGENVNGFSTLDAAAKSVEAVLKLIRDVGLPTKAGLLGMKEADIPAMVEEVLRTRGALIAEVNPRNANQADITAIYKAIL